MYFCKEICLQMAYKAIIAGASGLIGSELLTILLNQPEYAEVVILVRKSTGIQHLKLKELVIDYEQLDKYAAEISGHAIFSCLGTTNNKTPDKNIYRKIDHDYPVKLAQLGLKNGVKQFHLVSSLGADSKSSTFYLKLKGETDDDIQKVGLNTVHIYQPSFITGDRKEHRLSEKIFNPIMKLINPLLFGSFKKYRSISAQTIAMAMFKQSITNDEGVFIHPSDNIKQIA
jgi:uncharacterized protein YbjT (DUF2867 family)